MLRSLVAVPIRSGAHLFLMLLLKQHGLKNSDINDEENKNDVTMHKKDQELNHFNSSSSILSLMSKFQRNKLEKLRISLNISDESELKRKYKAGINK